jgi:hypothetical protein
LDKTPRDLLAAADNWLSVILAISTADEAQRAPAYRELLLYGAETELAAAAMAWREAGRPN